MDGNYNVFAETQTQDEQASLYTYYKISSPKCLEACSHCIFTHSSKVAVRGPDQDHGLIVLGTVQTVCYCLKVLAI